MDSPTSAAAKGSPGGSRIGRPPQWTISRSRKLARLYVYTTLSIEKIIKVLEDDLFRPRKNSAQKTVHKMLDNDPRYLRPESRAEMDQRITSLLDSPLRLRKRKKKATRPKPSEVASVHKEAVASSTDISSTSGSSRVAGDAASFDMSVSGRPTSSSASPARGTRAGLKRLLISARSQDQASGDTSESDTSSARVRRIKARVSDCSTDYARQVSRLLRDFTISSTSDLEDVSSSSRRPSAATSEPPEHPEDPSDTAFEAYPEPGYAVPGDFLTAHTRNCADFPGQVHGSGKCWCSIAEVTTSVEDSWLLPSGELSPRAQLVLTDPSDLNTSLRDTFGNTALHLFASREGYRDELFAMVLTSPTARPLTNTAGQTFLHVLHLDWFTDDLSHLTQLLAFLRDTNPSLFHTPDVYGRTFLHRACSLLRDPSPLVPLFPLSPFPPQRDAFNFIPLSPTNPYLPPRRPGSSRSSYPRITPPPPSTSESAFLAYHARLIQTIQSAYTTPLIQDSAGRNALHCLAQAILHQQAMDQHRTGATTRPGKRKLDLLLPSSPTDALSGGDATENEAETPLQPRLRHLHAILSSASPPQQILLTNHYSSAGETPLHAFIAHIPDSADDKAKTLLTLLTTLLRYGARIEARNRDGETALLIAARLGRKVALGMLLEQGANVHVRDVHGRGVLEVVDEACRGARGDVALYARLEACRGLLTGRRDWGVVRGGGVVEEWTRGEEGE
ncbi:hypothetical protein QBC34DRAFT_341807 [Podospora aff. communis PSN243]|uniref:Ankyrin n=1 Tax=Podospora aff. communis PSN243 TaxID=3040156 RepID=A0AAV9H3I0_9PEZI|nr:hypothetical protein QBC34DRAFT_341807 [Podospora aff. communis PSN243]